jgi:hypothetical protein
VKLITFHPDTDAEVTEAVQFYEARSPGLARLRGFNSLDKLLDFFSSKISNGRRFYRGLNRL